MIRISRADWTLWFKQDRLIEWSVVPLLATGAGFERLRLFNPQRFLAAHS
jgi:hypothetical protein